jgi:uncharacterized protein YceH (UPF0502 family)
VIDDEFWTPERARVLGALIEKGLATPQNYPLSLNALVGACNQTTNRDPVTELSESAVESLLVEAKADGLARFVHPRHGRGVTKYRHVVDEVLRLEPQELALIGVLLLRGPQTVGELRARTERLASFGSNDEVEQCLAGLAARDPGPLVLRLEREPGNRERRWVQLLCPAQGEDRVAGSSTSARVEQQPSDRPPIPSFEGDRHRAPEATAERPIPQAATDMAPDQGEIHALRAEVHGLREGIQGLQDELDQLRAAFEGFRRQFE